MMSISERLDRCVDDFTNINENMVVDQTGIHQLMENRDSKRARKYTKKGCSIRDQFLWIEEVSCIKD